MKRYKQFKDFKYRILVSTDLCGRGIDIGKVNVVFNYDMPQDLDKVNASRASDQYLHRVGRAGRFGTRGLTISFIATEEDEKVLQEIQKRFEVKIDLLPESIDPNKYMNN